MTKQPIATWADLFDHLGRSGVPLMHILSVSKQAAHQMRTKTGTIPPSHWAKLVAWAEANGEPINYDLLGRLAAESPAARVAAE